MRSGITAAVVLAWAGLVAGCSDTCTKGQPCGKQCGPGEAALCVAKGICSCTPSPGDAAPVGGGAGSTDAGLTNEAGEPVACLSLRPGTLVVNEALIDGDPSEDGEFVEVVNLADEPVNLAGLVLKSSRGESLATRVSFIGGCLPAHGAVAMFPSLDAWIYEPEPNPRPVANLSSFGFNNSAPFIFALMAADDTVISQMAGGADLIDPGVSVNRSPDLMNDAAPVKHTELNPQAKSSPGRCPNLGTYVNDCQDGVGPPVGGGVAPVGGGAAPVGGAGGASGDAGPPPPDMGPPLDCDEPTPGDLVLNELMIDGDPSEDEEFIELVSLSDRPLRLAGVFVESNRGAGLAERVRFTGGCLPPRGAVAMYADSARWIWDPAPAADTQPQTQVSNFGFSNSSDFHFLLKLGEGLLDEATGPDSAFAPGVSANRNPDRTGQSFARHDELAPGVGSSPGRCANGNHHPDGCAQ